MTSWGLLLLSERQEALGQEQPWKAEVAAFWETEKVLAPEVQAHRACLRLRLDQRTGNLHTNSESRELETVCWGYRELLCGVRMQRQLKVKGEAGAQKNSLAPQPPHYIGTGTQLLPPEGIWRLCYVTKATIATTKPQLSSAPHQMDSLTEEEICSLQGAGTIYQKIKLCYTQCPAFIRKPLDTQNS